MAKKKKRKSYLRNRNGSNYEIVSSRKSCNFKGHNDYLVRTSGGNYIIAHGWKPQYKSREQGIYYMDNKRAALRDFKTCGDYKRR